MRKYFKELMLWAFLALPYVYLTFIWNKLPDQVPTRFNINGVPDDWSAKTTLIWIPGSVGIGIYFLMLLIPVLDPKKKVQQMGDKYYSLRAILTIFFSLLSTYLLYATSMGSLKEPQILFALIGGLIAVLGNYFQTIRPNYFIGIRTPWTLENEQVWKSTHRLGGRLWIVGGILIVILAFAINNNQLFAILAGTILLVIVVVPVTFSYTEYKKIKQLQQN